jgi:hypothetical protein
MTQNQIEDLMSKSLDELAKKCSGYSNLNAETCKNEFLRRQTAYIIEAAEYSKKQAKYMFYSMLALTAAAIANAAIAIYTIIK